jgi:hypothetical protein
MGGMFSSGFNPNKLVPGKLYSTLDGKIYTYMGSEERTGMVTPGSSNTGTATVYNFTNNKGEKMSMTKNQLDNWKLEPVPDDYKPPQTSIGTTGANIGATGGRRKSRHGKRVRKAKTAKKGKK